MGGGRGAERVGRVGNGDVEGLGELACNDPRGPSSNACPQVQVFAARDTAPPVKYLNRTSIGQGSVNPPHGVIRTVGLG